MHARTHIDAHMHERTHSLTDSLTPRGARSHVGGQLARSMLTYRIQRLEPAIAKAKRCLSPALSLRPERLSVARHRIAPKSRC